VYRERRQNRAGSGRLDRRGRLHACVPRPPLCSSVTVPIDDGGTRSAVLEQARAKADSAGVALTHVREEAVRQIVLAENALRTSLSANDASTALASATDAYSTALSAAATLALAIGSLGSAPQ
jgi:outer membrane protein